MESQICHVTFSGLQASVTATWVLFSSRDEKNSLATCSENQPKRKVTIKNWQVLAASPEGFSGFSKAEEEKQVDTQLPTEP